MRPSLASSPCGLFTLCTTTFHFLPTKVSCNTDCSPLAPCQIQNPIYSSCDHYMVRNPPTSEQPPVRSLWSSEQGSLRVFIPKFEVSGLMMWYFSFRWIHMESQHCLRQCSSQWVPSGNVKLVKHPPVHSIVRLLPQDDERAQWSAFWQRW